MTTLQWEYRVVILARPDDRDDMLLNPNSWELVPNNTPQGLLGNEVDLQTTSTSYFERDGNALLAAAGHGQWRTRTSTSSVTRRVMRTAESVVRVYKRPRPELRRPGHAAAGPDPHSNGSRATG